MNNNTRTKNTLNNFFTSIFGQFLNIILQFIVRTVFISTLGQSFLGLNGLFSNILEMLSLAELGVGSAILFKIYKPISDNDQKRIILFLKFYKKMYQIIGLIILVVGISIIPFFRFIISDYESVKSIHNNIIFLYLLYLLRTIISYSFLAYKSAIVKANQKEYKLNIISYFVSTISAFLQIAVLKLFNSFELYILILVFAMILQNYLNAKLAKKMYPYIDDKTNESLSKNEIKDIFKDCGALLLYRINGVVLKATDNIVISSFLGINYVGLYSNYCIIYTTINSFFSKIFESVLHSIGNLHAMNDSKKEYEIFKTINAIAILLGSIAGIGVACVSNEFITKWIGEDWVISRFFSILLGIEIFTLSIDQFLTKYRSAMGLFQQAKMRPVIGSIINIFLSIILVIKLEISGVILGTIIANWTTMIWYDPYIIHKYGFKRNFSIKRYYIKNILYLFATIISGMFSYLICNNILVNYGWISIIVHSIITTFITLFVFIIFFGKTKEFKKIGSILKGYINKK